MSNISNKSLEKENKVLHEYLLKRKLWHIFISMFKVGFIPSLSILLRNSQCRLLTFIYFKRQASVLFQMEMPTSIAFSKCFRKKTQFWVPSSLLSKLNAFWVVAVKNANFKILWSDQVSRLNTIMEVKSIMTMSRIILDRLCLLGLPREKNVIQEETSTVKNDNEDDDDDK